VQPSHALEHEARDGPSGVACFNGRPAGDAWPSAARSRASSSHPAIAAAERKLGVKPAGFSTRVARLPLGVLDNSCWVAFEPPSSSRPGPTLCPNPLSTQSKPKATKSLIRIVLRCAFEQAPKFNETRFNATVIERHIT
jgi:hypothetical protein